MDVFFESFACKLFEEQFLPPSIGTTHDITEVFPLDKMQLSFNINLEEKRFIKKKMFKMPECKIYKDIIRCNLYCNKKEIRN